MLVSGGGTGGTARPLASEVQLRRAAQTTSLPKADPLAAADDVEAGPSEAAVRGSAPGDQVTASATADEVAAKAPPQHVSTGSTEDTVGTRAREHFVGSASGLDPVVPRPAQIRSRRRRS